MFKMNTRSLRVAGRLAAIVLLLPAIAAAAQVSALVANAGTTASAEMSPLAKRIDGMISKMQWGEGEVAALVSDADSAAVLYERQSGKEMQPGALMQLFTAAAALDRLGPDYFFTTEFGYTGTIDPVEKTLAGSLMIRSEGDPSISSQIMSQGRVVDLLDQWVGKVKDLKVRKITGTIVADGRAFEDEPFAPGWALDKIGAADLPTVTATNFNHNVFDFYWNAGKKQGKPATCRIFPDVGDYLRFSNHVTITKEARVKPRVYKRVERGNLIAVGGELAAKTEAHDRAAIEEPGRFFGEALKRRLIENKIEVAGKPGSTMFLKADELPTQTLTVLDRHFSPPLAKLLEHMVAEDSTLDAEVILKTMGMRADGRPGNFASGVRALNDYIERTILMPQAPHKIFDGSGRSALDRLTAANVIDLIRRAGNRPTGRLFESLLPRPGEGVLAGRGLDSRAPVRAKTASDDGVEAIAGMIDLGPGRRVLFVFIVNGSKAPVSVVRKQLDTLVMDLTHIGEAGRS